MDIPEFIVNETNEVTLEFDEEGKKIMNGYKKIRVLGRGSYSKVNLMEKNQKNYAVKIINKRALERKKKGFFKDEDGNIIVNSLLDDSLREVAILKKLNNMNVIKLYEIIHDDDAGKIYLVMECCNKGPVMAYDEFTGEFSINEAFLNSKKRKVYYSEDELRDIIRGIVMGLDYLHTNNIIHRDIKPDNILLNEENRTKITDFNVSKMLEKEEEDKVEKSGGGTMYFLAPECCEDDIKEFAGKPLDIWALGVTTFILTYKELPFQAENSENIIELLDKISNGVVTFPEKRMVTPELMDFMEKMFIRDPFTRITITELKEHPWINLNRTPLHHEKKAPKIVLTPEDMKSSLNFFQKMQMAKKCGEIWKKKSLNKAGRESITNIDIDKIKRHMQNIK